ncbi:MAG: hypothetical protein NT154_00060 [Verrucomicrobia bacterium]|nr:hypothetical protein [Verrucomicrobiota bacterium]
MRKRIIILALLLSLASGAIIWLVLSNSGASVSVSFAGTEPGATNRAAFYVRNTGHCTIALHGYRVQAAVDGAWKTLSEVTIEISQVPERGTTNFSSSRVLEAGAERRIIVPWPADQVLRVCIPYGTERYGLNAVFGKTRAALKYHSLEYWKSPVYGSVQWVYSEGLLK